MNLRFTILETSLNRAEFRWKWLRFLRLSFTLGIVVCALAIALAFAIISGVVTSKGLAITALVAVVGLGLLAWLVILITVLAGTPARPWLAAAVERVDRRLLDRLNTLLLLESKRQARHAESFAGRIAQQTESVLAEKPSPTTFPDKRPAFHLFAFIVAVVATICVYHFYSPWQRLLAAQAQKLLTAPRPEAPLELSAPAANNLEQKQDWGEVRITDPGSDLKVTKVDVVPLQIEAAANQSLKKVGWFSAVNGAAETSHDLPPPAEPRYAVYQPTLYLDEFGLADWDVMTYYARANGERTNSFASDVYFLEVRPFREDILKMPGGEGGKAYQCLNQMTALINGQQHVIRETHQHIQKPPAQENLQAQDRAKLAEAENDLGESSDHLYAQMAAEMENKPIGPALDALARASKSLSEAGSLLKTNALTEAPNRERRALTELVAARKIFQKAVSDNPKAFEERDPEESPPVAETAKKLSEIAEFRNETQAGRQFVQKTLDQQRNLERRAKGPTDRNQPQLAQQERELQKSLEDFQHQHPQVFTGAEGQSQAAEQAMSKAAEAMEGKHKDSSQATRQATEELEKLNQAISDQSATRQLADAYKLKQMLDRQIGEFDQFAKTSNNIPEQDLQNAANQARQTVDQLKKAAEQDPTRDAFSQPLRDALSGTNKVDLDTKLNELQQASDQAAKKEKSGEVRNGLQNVSKAFAASEPKALQAARQSDALKPGDQESFAVGMAQLESLIKQLENNRQLSPSDQAKQGQESLHNLQQGLQSQSGNIERGTAILGEFDNLLKAERKALEVADLKKLMDELQHFSVETSDRLAKKEDQPVITNIDPSRLPPAYRGRIQKYFQKLSEK
jgi:hypothetical protein